MEKKNRCMSETHDGYQDDAQQKSAPLLSKEDGDGYSDDPRMQKIKQ